MIRRGGRRRTWLEWLEPVEGPPWVEEIINGVPEGSRHNCAIGLVGRWYGRGFDADEVRRALIVWNELNEPPMSDNEITSILTSTFKWERSRRRNLPKEKKQWVDEFDIDIKPTKRMKPTPMTDAELKALPKALRDEILELRTRNSIKSKDR